MIESQMMAITEELESSSEEDESTKIEAEGEVGGNREIFKNRVLFIKTSWLNPSPINTFEFAKLFHFACLPFASGINGNAFQIKISNKFGK
jgi:hypothetical protein